MLNSKASAVASIALFAITASCTTLIDLQLEDSATRSTNCDDTSAASRERYPTENLGTLEGMVVENHVFTNTDGSDFSLQEDVFRNQDAKLLLLVTAAGWCTACREEQPALENLYQTYRAQGLELVVAIFEDNNINPVTTDFAAAWKDSYNLSFPVVADIDFQLGAYYDPSLTPMAMLVDVDTMQILNIQIGAQPTVLETLVQTQLADSDDCDEPNNRAAYPSSNIGTLEGDTLAPLTFTNIDGSTFSLDNDVYKKTEVNLLLLVTAAGWCTACREEQPALEDIYQSYRAQGFELVVAVFEDNNVNPVTTEFAGSWRDSYNLSFPVVADIDFKLGAYYDPSLTPMAMLVDVNTMTILNIQIGAQPTTLETLIQSQL